eukprot:scaffold69212_cov64-Phaeocystis_antarctica.AAC.3
MHFCRRNVGAVFACDADHSRIWQPTPKLVPWRPRRCGTASSRCSATWGSPSWWANRRHSWCTTAFASSPMSLTSTSQALQACPPAPTCARKVLTRVRALFAAATLRSNNLGGQGPGPGKCNAALPAGDAGQDERCGFYDLNTTHPYYQKMGASLCSSAHAT